MRSQVAAGLSDNLSDGTYGPGGMPVAQDEKDTRTPEQMEADRQDSITLLEFRQSIADSTHYMDTNYRRQWESNIANFQGRHPAGSRYHTNGYKFRSKLHMPKVRAAEKRWSAALTSAFFSTRDALVVEAENQNDKQQAASAALWKQVMQYRLMKTMPWFQTVLGAGQDAFVNGVCITHNFWRYEEDGDGNVIHDTPACDLVPIENLRFSPAADWRDPINDSEYLDHIMPMTVNAIKAKMATGEWAYAPDSLIAAATRDYDSTSHARQDTATDTDKADTVAGHQIAYVHKHIKREQGIDYIFFVLGQEHLLTVPTRLDSVNPNGIRNYTLGHVDIEAHKVYAQSPVQQMESLLASLNESVNMRKDNVRLALNKRYTVKRGSPIDIPQLMRNVPGGTIMVNDHTDVEPLETNDVTASSYKEQEFDGAMFDEIAGTFNSSSINTNRRMGETVGGMELLASDVNVVTEHKLEVFANTWMGPTLEQLFLLEQAYETDFVIMAMAANDADIHKQYGVDEITTEMINQNLMVSINFGVDATNPARAIDKLGIYIQHAQLLGKQLDTDEVLNELAGRMGYDNGGRFLLDEQQQAEQAQNQQPSPEQQQAEAQAASEQLKAQVAEMKMQVDSQKLQLEGQKLEMTKMKQDQDFQLAQAKLEADITAKREQLAVQRDIAEESTETQIGIAMVNDKTTRETAALQAETAIQAKIMDGEIATQAQEVQREAKQIDSQVAARGQDIQREAKQQDTQTARQGQEVTREANHLKDRQAANAVKSKAESDKAKSDESRRTGRDNGKDRPKT